MPSSQVSLHELFRVDGTVPRGRYVRTGLVLALVKYTFDTAAALVVMGQFWDPRTYFDPSFAAHRMGTADGFPAPLLVFLILSALPFLWIGVAYSSRRARDAGKSWWLGMLFLVPIVRYFAILGLALLPPAARPAVDNPPDRVAEHSTLLAALGSVVLGLLVIAGFTEGLDYYGPALFVGTPMMLGVVVGYLGNVKVARSGASTVALVAGALLAGFLGLLTFGLEGIVCLAMAYPLAFVVSVPGALMGRAIARTTVKPDVSLLGVALFLPLGGWLEMQVVEAGEREVRTSIEIEAPPDVVWQHVVAFSELPPPDHWLFDTGIAYPLRARIEGHGVGAVRYCEFSTGPFVEPITVWDEPRRLAFDVASQPAPMEEWSFYANVHPPHLDSAFRSVRGEFRLIPLEEGRTRLEGSTWYQMKMGPTPYWNLWGDEILHRIHRRVLRHIRRLSE